MAEPQFGLAAEKAPKAVQASLEPIIRFFSYHDAHPIALGMVCMEQFPVDWFDWDPEALKAEILEQFKATSISEHNWQKLQAFRTLMQATSPWTEWEVFENVVQALNNNIPEIHVVQPCTMSQLMAGVDIMNQVRDEGYDDEVAKYIAACAIEEGVTYLPPPLHFGQEELSEPKYICRDCNNIGDGVPSDGRCDYCCERYGDDRPLNGKPNPRLPKTCGRNITAFVTREHTGVPEKFTEFRAKEEVDLDPESPIEVQAAKLSVAHQYMLLRRRQLLEQLEELESWLHR